MLDRDTMLSILTAHTKAHDIGDELRRVAAFYGMPTGRPWRDIPDADVERLYRHTIGSEPLPALTPDDCEAGRKFNESLPF